MKKKWLALGLALVMSVAMAFQPMTVQALEKNGEIWDDLSGESTVNSVVTTSDNIRLWTTIKTNYHAPGITGLVVQTSKDEVNRIMGISNDDWWKGIQPILYVAQSSQSTTKDVELMHQYAKSLGGKAWYDYEILMFKWTGTWNESITKTAEPIRMTVGIKENEQTPNTSYAMLHLKDGVGTFYYDLDTDNEIVTFETSDFSGIYVLVSFPTANKPANTTPAGSTTQAGQNTPAADELDKVPKMGDEQTVILPALFVGSVLLFVAAFFYRRKEA